jgi:[protein-PII] uridylyltransferase
MPAPEDLDAGSWRALPPPPEIRPRLEAARGRMAERLAAGARGTEVCRELSDVCDDIVARLVGETDLAVVATGGWGRRELCPFSDLDILVVAGDVAAAGDQVEQLLYPLWDSGLRVGHAVRDPIGAAELAAGDLRTATPLLDARLVAGSRELVESLDRAVWRAIAPGGDGRDLVRKLADEKSRRHRRFGDSLYLLEPNIKHGIGGLRDLSTALWAARARFRAAEIDELIGLGQLSRRQVEVLSASRDFLLALRCRLQLQANRPTDQLSFEIQEAIAPALYPDAEPQAHKSAVAPAVEALMRDYYAHARDVAQIADQLIDSASMGRRKPSVARVDGSFVLFAGKLSAASSEVFDRRPAEMLRLYRVAARLEVPVYWHTGELIAERLADGAGAELAGDREAAAHFMEALADTSDRGQPSRLEAMHQVGLVSAMIPDFGPCTHRVQHDLYHVYTVDQHQLYAVRMLKRIARGELEAEHPLATQVYRRVERVEPLYLATLLHDVGKPLGKGHSETGAAIARKAGLALGLSGDEAARAGELVRQHLSMNHIGQRRDLSDPEVIRKFAARVGDLEGLRQLYLLTICDTAMTSPGNLTAWKAQLLGELYRLTKAHFEGAGLSRGAGGEAQTALGRRRCAELLQVAGDERALELLEAVDDHVVMALSPRQLFRLLRLAAGTAGGVGVEVRAYPIKGHSELLVVGEDAPGLLADITGAIAAFGISVEGAVIGSLEAEGSRPLATDLFFIRDAAGAVAPTDPRWEQIRALIGERDPEAVTETLARRSKSGLPPRVTPEVATEVGFADGASDKFSVLEVFTRDRTGLLSEIARALADAGVDIVLAKVSTEGERAVDAFYIRDPGGGVLTAEREAEVVAALIGVLE